MSRADTVSGPQGSLPPTIRLTPPSGCLFLHRVAAKRSALSLSVICRQTVGIGRRLYERGLIVAAEGNISVRLSDGNVLVTPAGMCKGLMKATDLVVVDTAGRKMQGSREPSSELKMHLVALARRSDVGACVHAHPPYATAFAVAGIPLTDDVLPEVITTIRSVPLAPYATPSTAAVGESIRGLVDRFDAILLKNHGVLTLGADLESAFRKMETVERFAQIVWLARSLGKVDTFPPAEVETLLDLSRRTVAREPVAEKRTGRKSPAGRKRTSN